MFPNDNKLKVPDKINDLIKDNQTFAITICWCKLNMLKKQTMEAFQSMEILPIK